jgi:prepilin-type N-terminal cleavage/methylation domain-containing protein/prepilin-type processing-associated H-X9-DG protein
MMADLRSETRQRGFTLVEMLIVILVIGVLVALLLPAIQAAREAARRTQCLHHLSQLIIAVQNYQLAFDVYPPGTQAGQGPIEHHEFGYHHSWITQLLPYMEQKNAYQHIDWTVGVYHQNNAEVRRLLIDTLTCPSAASTPDGFTSYAGVHHDVEAPIDADNNGVLFLNSRLGPDDVADGVSQTLFIGEKIVEPGDLGWMSGTRASLRNTGTPINITGRIGDQWNWHSGGFMDPFDDFSDEDDYFYGADVYYGGEEYGGDYGVEYGMGGPEEPLFGEDGELLSPEEMAERDEAAGEGGGETDDRGDQSNEPENVPAGPVLPVGGLASPHTSGAQFAFGDGSVRFLSESISIKVYQQLGHRSDGQLLDAGDY